MGMDLMALRSGEDPVDKSKNWCLSYNWGGWHYLIEKLGEWGVPTDEFRGFNNDGDVISVETCIAVANALERNLSDIEDPEDRMLLAEHIDAWRYSGGFAQW